jgi:sigma-B regulation protein RsbU (phosphoserine phosphatase)
MYVTMVAGVFDPRDGNLTIANAGHLPVLLFSDNGKISKIGAQSPPLGILPQAEFPTLNIKLVEGSVCLYSDGVTESLSPMGEELGIEGLIKLLIEAEDQPPRQRLESIVTRLRSEANSPRDDITLLLLHSVKQSSAWMH